jgi:SAM-dependent methyltransferase
MASETPAEQVRALYEARPYPPPDVATGPGFVLSVSWLDAHRHPHGSMLDPGRRVLVAGCGRGDEAHAIAMGFPRAEVVGVDFSARAVELCTSRLSETPRANVRFVCADAGDTGLAGAAYDLVIAADLFEHLYPDDAARVTAEAFRLLAPGGHFAVWTPHRGHVLESLKNRDIVLKRDPSHVDYKSMADMKRLLSEAGFAIDKAYYAESHVPVLRVAERILQRVVPFLRRRIAVLGRKPEA